MRPSEAQSLQKILKTNWRTLLQVPACTATAFSKMPKQLEDEVIRGQGCLVAQRQLPVKRTVSVDVA
jgi:hypothetical protein